MNPMKIKRQWLFIPLVILIVSFASVATHATKPQPPWVGARTTCVDCKTDPAILWNQKNTAIADSKLTLSRDFDPTIRPVGKESWRKVPSPKHFYSMKPPNGDIAGFIAGQYDRQYRKVVAALPPQTKITVQHEPEDEMSGETFYSLIKHAYALAHSVRQDIEVWYVATAFQWETNSKGNVATSEGWLDAAKFVDRVGIDVYASDRRFKDIARSEGFMKWWKQIAVPAGKAEKGQWGIVERGISGSNGEQARINILNADWSWAAAHHADLFLYWNVNTRGNYYELDRPNEQKAFQAIAAVGRQP
jgi:hypothetical protein